MHSVLFFLCVDAFLEVVEVDPALCLLIQLRAQPLLLLRQLLQPDIIAAAGRLGLAARLELLLQRSDLLIDGLKFPLLLVGKFQLLLPRPLRLRFFGFFRLFCLLRRALAHPVGPVAGKDLDRPAAAHLKDRIRHLVKEEPVVRDGNDRPRKALQIILEDRQRRHVQIVGRLVQQQYVRRSHQNGQQIHPPPFAAGEPADHRLLQIRREEKPLEHRLGRECPLVGPDLVRNAVDEVKDLLVQIQLAPKHLLYHRHTSHFGQVQIIF